MFITGGGLATTGGGGGGGKGSGCGILPLRTPPSLVTSTSPGAGPPATIPLEGVNGGVVVWAGGVSLATGASLTGGAVSTGKRDAASASASAI